MSSKKKRKKGSKDRILANVVFATATVNLIGSLIGLISKLID